MKDSTTPKRLRRKPRRAHTSSYVPVDLSGNPISVSSFPTPKAPTQRPLSPEEAKRRQAPLNLRNDGFRLLH
ncbi:MAG: hypothetical protein ACJ8CB_26550 [Ktedonobacteraceae bacterium]